MRETKWFMYFVFLSLFFALFLCSNQFVFATTVEQSPATMTQQDNDEQDRQSASKENTSGQSNQAGILKAGDNQFKIVDSLYQKIDHLRHRFSNLLTYGTPLAPSRQNTYSADIHWQNEWKYHPLGLFALLAGVFLAAFIIELLFKRFIKKFIPESAKATGIRWYKKVTASVTHTVFDVCGLFIFMVSVFAILLFLDKNYRPGAQILSSCLTAILIVKTTLIISRTLIAPVKEELRIIPITTDSARYIHHRVVVIAGIGAFGWLASGIAGLFSTLQSVSFLSFLITSILVCSVLIIICFEKKADVCTMLLKTLPQSRAMREIAQRWHQLAIFYIITTWLACFFGLLLVGPKTIVPAGVTILAIPLFFITDWLLQSLVDWWLYISKREIRDTEIHELTDEVSGDLVASEVTPINKSKFSSQGFAFGLRLVIRVVLAALLFFNLLSMWGVELVIGKIVTSAVMNSIIAILICVIIWGVANRAIERILKQELPDQGEETEEGGAGGSRKGTLFLLMQKFLLSVLVIISFITVLASMGINIGPLIAGAGVLGLAIGFGAQTLVRDIISGIFFLMDDAFRVGDFVDTGSSQGTVEHISLRSLRIRHPRGMVHTIPFGDIPAVTNYSRDYIITKLDFRVPFDTDIDKIRKIVKGIYNDILADEELGPKLLGKMKSQGVRELDDSALIMRIKFKSIPGEQFVLRREVYRRLQEAFHENGLQFASRKVMVEMPKEDRATPSNKNSDGAAAAAAQLASNQPSQQSTKI